jgi:quercetin dioxygenase-like cupin family protein
LLVTNLMVIFGMLRGSRSEWVGVMGVGSAGVAVPRSYDATVIRFGMETVTTGRPLDENGDPTDGPALEMDPEGPAAKLFAESSHALASGPGTGMWSALLRPLDADGETAMLVWLSPDATELPAHVHTEAEESFRTLEGELTVVEEGATHRLGPGEEYTVSPDREHYFRNDTGDFVAFHVELPWSRTAETQFTLFGLDHEGAFGRGDEYGEPGFLHGLVMSEYLREGTRIPAVPLAVQRALWATVGRAAKALGYRAVHDEYLRDEFWEETVEQPDL